MSRQKDRASGVADEIVEEIVDHLRPWNGRQTREAITIAASEQLERLRQMIPLQAKLYDRSRMRAHAQELDKLLNEVEELLYSDPGGLNVHLFLPPSLSESEMASKETILLSFQERAAPFFAELKRLRQVCAQAIDPGFGLHPNYDHAKSLCAWFAHALMSQLSNAKITGTKDAPFRAISGLLYEAVSGAPDADLKRACSEVLRYKRPLGTDRPRKFIRACTNKKEPNS
jgi:hypothetical protein